MNFSIKRGDRQKKNDGSRLFEGLKGVGIEGRLDVALAVMIPMVVMMWADQEKDEAETALIHSIRQSSPIFLNPSKLQIDGWITQADSLIHEAGMNDEKACMRAGASLTEPLRQTAFAFAVLVLFADEKVVDAEKLKAQEMAAWLGIKDGLARDIVKVISILRHGRDAR